MLENEFLGTILLFLDFTGFLHFPMPHPVLGSEFRKRIFTFMDLGSEKSLCSEKADILSQISFLWNFHKLVSIIQTSICSAMTF